MKNTLLFVIASTFLFVGCSDSSLVGNSCVVDSDCGSGFCLHELSDGAEKDPHVIEFIEGMCTEECEDLGGFVEFEICLWYLPTDEGYIFDLCRNDMDCRTEDSYYCTSVGESLNLVGITFGINACLPVDAIIR